MEKLLRGSTCLGLGRPSGGDGGRAQQTGGRHRGGGVAASPNGGDRIRGGGRQWVAVRQQKHHLGRGWPVGGAGVEGWTCGHDQ
jgi:hypothetical protein